MNNSLDSNKNSFPYLLNRSQASEFLGIDPKSFDKYIRSNSELKRFMIGNQERYIREQLIAFIKSHLTEE